MFSNKPAEKERDAPASPAPSAALVTVHRAVPLDRAPALDGALGGPAWSGIPGEELGFDAGKIGPASVRTLLRAGYDRTGLYLGIRCDDESAAAMRATIAADGSKVLWTDDCVEVYVAAGDNGCAYRQFIVNPLGARSEGGVDGAGRDIDPLPGAWKAAAARDAQGWGVVLFIPFAELGAGFSPEPGSILRFAVRRFAPGGSVRRSAVSAPGAGQGKREAFGRLVLSGTGESASGAWAGNRVAAVMEGDSLVFDRGACLFTRSGEARALSWGEAVQTVIDTLRAGAGAFAARCPAHAAFVAAALEPVAAVSKAETVFDALRALAAVKAARARLVFIMNEVTSAGLWRSYAASPDTHRNIPNCSYAGYRAGRAPFPEPPVVADVRACGARGDGLADETEAFEAAIRKAKAAGGGAIFVPAGRYRLTSLLRLDRSGLVLRGESRERTTLFFERPLADLARSTAENQAGFSGWSYSGGLVWVGRPSDWVARASAAAPPGDTRLIAADEGWVGSGDPRAVAGEARRGDCEVRVRAPAAAGLKPGMTVLMSWENPADNSLFCFLAGHARMKAYPWESMGRTAGLRWFWVAKLAAVGADAVTLAQPLRVDIRPEWNVTIEPLGAHITEAGVEHLTLEVPPHERKSHCKDAGYNGIYFCRAVDCWARDVAVVNADNAINLSAAKQVTVRDFELSGGPGHHGTTTRTWSHDTLVTDFRIESTPLHGLNVEGFSSGNVWRRGVMIHGSFDFHRGLSYESIRTDITLSNDGKPGGNDSAGPRLGARCVHWNLRVTRREVCSPSMPGVPPHPQVPGRHIYQPDLVSDGALVGVQGCEPCLEEAREPWGTLAMVPGDKNCLVADHGLVPEPPDLYQAQFDLRTGG